MLHGLRGVDHAETMLTPYATIWLARTKVFMVDTLKSMRFEVENRARDPVAQLDWAVVSSGIGPKNRSYSEHERGHANRQANDLSWPHRTGSRRGRRRVSGSTAVGRANAG